MKIAPQNIHSNYGILLQEYFFNRKEKHTAVEHFSIILAAKSYCTSPRIKISSKKAFTRGKADVYISIIVPVRTHINFADKLTAAKSLSGAGSSRKKFIDVAVSQISRIRTSHEELLLLTPYILKVHKVPTNGLSNTYRFKLPLRKLFYHLLMPIYGHLISKRRMF